MTLDEFVVTNTPYVNWYSVNENHFINYKFNSTVPLDFIDPMYVDGLFVKSKYI